MFIKCIIDHCTLLVVAIFFVLPHINSVKFHASAQFYLAIIFLVASVDHTLPYDEEE